jgi:heat shock protein HtpX
MDFRSTGRLGVLLLAMFVVLPLLLVLLGVYVGSFGGFPFEFQPGPFGLPPWVPFLALSGAIAIAGFLAIVFRHFGPDVTFYDQQRTNTRNALLLTVAITSGLALVAYVIGAVVTLRTSIGLGAAVGAVAAGLIIAAVSWWAGDRIVLRTAQARPVSAEDAPQLHDVVAEMSIAANIPPPAVYLVDDSAPNAFAAGRDPGHAVLGVTSGLVEQLTREELQGVIAHEIAHIRNYDSRYDLFVAVLVGSTVLIADGFFRIVTLPFRIPAKIATWAMSDHGGSSGPHVSGSGSSGGWSFPDLDFDVDSDTGKALPLILAIAIFVLLVLFISFLLHAIAPVFARLAQASVSREREYLADATAVELGRNPDALERALLKVARNQEALEVANRATAPLWFVTPIRAWERRAAEIYSTHPPTIDRVNRLRELQRERPIAAAEIGDLAEDVE